jgi:hypothetical protein
MFLSSTMWEAFGELKAGQSIDGQGTVRHGVNRDNLSDFA